MADPYLNTVNEVSLVVAAVVVVVDGNVGSVSAVVIAENAGSVGVNSSSCLRSSVMESSWLGALRVGLTDFEPPRPHRGG